MRLPMELRIIGGSLINLAPQFGNMHGTCALEILTPNNVDRKEWEVFMQEVTDAWTNIRDENGDLIYPLKRSDGMLLYPRPHWAKDWECLKVNGQPIKVYLREKACRHQIKLYNSGLESVAKSGGYNIEDASNIFSTAFSREMFSEDDGTTHGTSDGSASSPSTPQEVFVDDLVMSPDDDLSC